LRPLLDPFNTKVKDNFVILMKCTKKTNLGRICLRYPKFRFVYASAVAYFAELASAATGCGNWWQ
jgi:hypothetical protein